MHSGKWQFLGVLNVLLAGGLIVLAMWLYGREHATRQLERQIRKLEQARVLEEETIRRLRVEWQALRNPMRLEPLAATRLKLRPPHPSQVRALDAALSAMPWAPAPTAPAREERAALDDLAAQAAGEASPATMKTSRAPRLDPLAGLIRDMAPQEER